MNSSDALSSLLSLRGRTALVAGGSGGIGSAVVTLLKRAGAEVFSLDLPGRPVPEGAKGLACDLADADGFRKFVPEFRARIPSLDCLLHCAGIARDSLLWKMEESDWAEVIETNLGSAFRLLKACVPLLRQSGGGSVVLVSSINGERGKFGQANYAASKGGLNALAKTAAIELGRFGIRVNAVAPGLIRTEMSRALREEFRRKAEEESALGRIGEPEDVARAALFLCSDLGRHVTGQVIRVDGGQLMA